MKLGPFAGGGAYFTSKGIAAKGVQLQNSLFFKTAPRFDVVWWTTLKEEFSVLREKQGCLHATWHPRQRYPRKEELDIWGVPTGGEQWHFIWPGHIHNRIADPWPDINRIASRAAMGLRCTCREEGLAFWLEILRSGAEAYYFRSGVQSGSWWNPDTSRHEAVYLGELFDFCGGSIRLCDDIIDFLRVQGEPMPDQAVAVSANQHGSVIYRTERRGRKPRSPEEIEDIRIVATNLRESNCDRQTYETIAAKIGASVETVSKHFRGEQGPWNYLKRYAVALDVSLDRLLAGTSKHALARLPNP